MQIIIYAFDCSYMRVFLAIGPKASVGVFSRSQMTLLTLPGLPSAATGEGRLCSGAHLIQNMLY